jgi:hypothetical protein
MTIITTGQAEIRHKQTAVSVFIQPEELDWQQVSAHEDSMGPNVQRVAELEHPDLGALSFELWEYPVGFAGPVTSDLNGHTLVRGFNVTIQEQPSTPADG